MAIIPTTFDPANKAAAITLSNGNRTAANATTTFGSVLSVFRATTATKYYWEVTTGANCGSSSFGITDPSFTLAGDISANVSSNTAVLTSTGAIKVNAATQATLAGVSFASGNTFCIACDVGAALIWFRAGAAGLWNNSGTANPATGVGGIVVNAIVAVPSFPAIAIACLGGVANSDMTANFGNATFVGAVPSGYETGLGGPVLTFTPTTWNPSDKTAALTLSNGNLTATNSGTSAVGVRSIASDAAGKYYWECTIGATAGSTKGCGVANATANLTIGVGTGTASFAATGAIYVDGTQSGTLTIGTIVANDVICMALDMPNRLMWFRKGAAGSWNATSGSTNNPATATGGASLSTITSGSGQPLFAYYFTSGTTNAASTTNFGATGFVGAVPSGFQPGFGTPIPAAQLTQAALEQWAMPNANAQLTQVALEMWGPAGTTTPLAVATQVAMEQWASVQAAIIAAQQARAIILA